LCHGAVPIEMIVEPGEVEAKEARTTGGDGRLAGRLARGGALNLFGSITGRCLGVVFVALIGRVLDPVDVGRYFLGMTAMRLSSVFGLMGLDTGVRRYVAYYRGRGMADHVRGTLRLSVVLALVLSCIMAAGLFFCSGWVATQLLEKPAMLQPLRWFALALPFLSVSTVVIRATQGFQVMTVRIVTRNLLEPVIRLLLTVVLFLAGFRLGAAVLGYGTSLVVSSVVGLVFLRRIFPRPFGRPAKMEVGELVRFSAPLTFTAFLGLLMIWMDTLLLGRLATLDAVGAYNLAHRLVEIGALGLASIQGMFGPMAAQLYAQGRKTELASLFKVATKWVIAGSLPIYLLCMTFPDTLMMLFGRRYAEAGPCLAVLSLGFLIQTGTGSVGILITMTGRSWVSLANNVLALGLNVPLNLILIPRFGIVGAASATTISFAVLNLLRIAELFYFEHIHAYRWNHIKPVLAAMVAVGMALVTARMFPVLRDDLALFCGLAIGYFAIYTLALIALGLDQEDRDLLGRARRKLKIGEA